MFISGMINEAIGGVCVGSRDAESIMVVLA